MTVQKPAITVIGTNGNNIWHGSGMSRKLAIITHVMQGSLSGCDTWFSNPAAQASSNYGIGKDGSIHQYVDPQGKDAPYANGIVNNPDGDAQAIMATLPGVNPNWYTVSIEHEGMSAYDAVHQTGTPFVLTDAQLAASAQLCAWLCQTFSIPVDEAHILGHYEIDSVTRAGCPGWDRAGWVRYVNAVQAAMGGQPDPNTVIAQLQADLATAQANAARYHAALSDLAARATAASNS